MNLKKAISLLNAIALVLPMVLTGFLLPGNVKSAEAAPAAISYWPAEGSANDAVGANHGALLGGATFAAGRTGQAFSFDGADDYVSVPSTSTLDITVGDFTVDAWINPSAIGSAGEGIIGKLQSDNSSGWGLVVQGGDYGTPGKLNFFMGDGSGGHFAGQSSGTISTGTWSHVAVTRSGDSLTYYLNGAPSGSYTAAGNFDNALSLLIGDAYPTWPGSVWRFNGLIDDVEIYDRALTDGEVVAVYGRAVSSWPAEGNASDTIGSNHGALQGSVDFAVGRVGQAFSFDGAESNFVEIPNSSSLNPSAFSVDGWFYVDPAAIGNAGEIATLIGKSDGSTASGWSLYFDDRAGVGSSKSLKFVMGDIVELPNAMPTPDWYHVAAVYDAAAMPRAKLYLNGVRVGDSGAWAGGMGANSLNLKIGAMHWTDSFHEGNDRLNGLADEVRFFDRALSDGEVAGIYGSVPPLDVEPPLTTVESTPAPDGDNDWYTTAPAVTLTPDETAAVYYQWDSTATWEGDGLPDASVTVPGIEGTHTLYYRSIDTAGNTETVKSLPIKVDTADPTDPTTVISTSHTTSTPSNDNTIDIAFSGAADTTSGVAGYSVRFDENSSAPPPEAVNLVGPGGDTTETTTSGPLLDGSWYAHISTKDNAGNWTSTAHIGPFVIDTAAPTGGTISINSGAAKTNSTAVNLSLSAVDTNSGMWLMSFSNDGVNWPSGWQDYETSAPWNLIPGDGTKRVYVRFKDNAHNIATAVFDKILLDGTGPGAAVTAPAISTNVSKTKTFSVSWAGTDATPGNKFNLSYKVGASGAWQPWKTAVAAGSANFTGAQGNTYYFKAQGKDALNNAGPYSAEAKTIVPLDQSKGIVKRVGFAGTISKASSNYYLGTVRYSTTKGDVITYSFTGKYFALIGTKGPKYSKAVVIIDGVKKTIDAKAGSKKLRQVLMEKSLTMKKHTVKIKNLGTARRTRFEIDGLGVGK